MEVENEKAISLYEKAIALSDNKYNDAIKLLLDAVKLEPEYVAAYFILADIFYQKALKSDVNDGGTATLYTQRDFNNAFRYYEKVITICPAYQNYYSCYILGKHNFKLDKSDKALPLLRMFADHNPPENAEVKQAMAMLNYMQTYADLVNNPVPFNPVSLEGVSSKGDEYLPLISPDNEIAFYTRAYNTIDKLTTIQKSVEEFTFSTRIWSSSIELAYTKGEPMPNPFNTSANQGAITITIDNNHMFFTRCDYAYVYETYYNNCDIYQCDFDGGMWTDPVKLGNNINGKDTWESQPTISSDGKILYFASARPGGEGGIDIYYSEKDEHDEWGKACNIGKAINTKGDEKSPFIHSDSKTLYFSTNGRTGLGGFDIFYSRHTGKNEWSEPKNIGYPINTEDDDLGFIVSTDGKKAFFSSNKLNGKGGWDIYSFDLYEAARPQKVMFLKGQVFDNNGKGLTDGKVEVTSITSNHVTEGLVDKLSGKYAVAVTVEPMEEFIMTVRKPKYTFSSQLLKPEEEEIVNGDKPKEMNVEISPVAVGVSFRISDILFATNSALFDDAGKIILESLFGFLNENPRVKLAIYGHTDNVGDEQSNIVLSENRAMAVHNFLLEHGIASNRLVSKGFGESVPVGSNDSEEGRARNRRTEFVILEN